MLEKEPKMRAGETESQKSPEQHEGRVDPEIILPYKELKIIPDNFAIELYEKKHQPSGELVSGIEEVIKILREEDKQIPKSVYEKGIKIYNDFKPFFGEGRVTEILGDKRWSELTVFERQFTSAILIATFIEWLNKSQKIEDVRALEVGAGTVRGYGWEVCPPICARILGMLGRNNLLKIEKLMTIQGGDKATDLEEGVFPEYEEKFGVTALIGFLDLAKKIDGEGKRVVKIEVRVDPDIEEPSPKEIETAHTIINSYPYDLIYGIWLATPVELALIPLLKDRGRAWILPWAFTPSETEKSLEELKSGSSYLAMLAKHEN